MKSDSRFFSTILINPTGLGKYIETKSKQHPVMKKLNERNQNDKIGYISIQTDQALFLQQVVRSLQAKLILEIGTYTGYSALAMSLAQPNDGKLITCDINETSVNTAKTYWKEAGVINKIEPIVKSGVQVLDDLIEKGNVQFDLVFIDADKPNYKNYYEKSFKLLRKHGVILIDNIFWLSLIVNEKAQDADTTAIRELNDQVLSDERITACMLPIGDGVMYCVKQ